MRHTTPHKRPPISDESGQTMAEYGVVLVAIALAVVVVMPTLASAIANLLRGVITAFGG